MKVSLNTVKQYIQMELPPLDELVERINAQLGAIEEIVDLGAKYKDARIVKVTECSKHPNADKLSVCLIDDGGAVEGVERSQDGLVQVVCGAPNAKAGMWAVWLPPSSTVPASFDDTEPFVLGARELRGVMSNGMLASAQELAIGDDHSGIIDITEKDLKPGQSLAIGASFAEIFGLDDTIIDIENKMFTHRPDLFGQLGVAREIRAILQPEPSSSQHTEPDVMEADWYWAIPELIDGAGLDLKVFNDTLDQSPRFMAAALSNVVVGDSPLWLRCELVRWGGKPVNNVVDLTNYIMLLTAQPVHAYDYDKLRGKTLGVRMAKSGETVTLLNNKTYQLDEDDIVIADGEGVIGLAGIMGGRDSEVSSETKNIVLEVATFDMYALRRSSMRHGLFTDALTRFNKGQSELQNDRVIARLIDLFEKELGAKLASPVFDANNFTDDTDKGSLHGEQVVAVDFINQRLGLDLNGILIGNILRATNFAAYKSGEGQLSIAAPFWRTDIELPEDIVEEVGRLYGYDRLPRHLPQRSVRPAIKNDQRELAQSVRQALAQAGANEVLTYSFVHERTLRAAGQDADDAYGLSNALSPDLQYYRLSLTPSLLDKVHSNVKSGFDEFALFEIGKAHSKKAGLDKDGLPLEPGRMALTYASKTTKDGAAYYRAKKMLDHLAGQLGLDFEYKPLAEAHRLTAAAPFAEQRLARVIDRNSSQAVGIIGEYKPSVKKAYKLPGYSAGFELFSEGLLLAKKSTSGSYQPLSRYPSTERDVCFEVPEGVVYSDVYQTVWQELDKVKERSSIEPLDIYESKTTKRRITLRIRLTPDDGTMTGDQINDTIDQAASSVAKQLGATIV